MMSSCSFPKPLFIMGTKVVPFESYDHVLKCVESSVACGRKTFCVAINPEKAYRALHDPALRAAVEQADIGVCDGVGIALAARLLYGRRLRRCTGVDLFMELIGLAARKKWKVFLLGASTESNEQACRALLARYPGLQIAGSRDGYFKEAKAVVEEINASGADLLFVAMGSPRQELWIAEHRDAINAPFCMGVGGTFDVISGRVKRAPRIFRKTGTEFLFRLFTDPRRWKRQLALPLFMVGVLKQKLLVPRSIG